MKKRDCFWGKLTAGLFAVLLMTIITGVCGAQERIGCYDSKGNIKSNGSRWTEVYNGVTYDCVCDGGSANGVTSTPRGTNGSVNTSSQNDFRLMLVESFLNFIFSDNTQKISQEDKEKKERQIKEQQRELERIKAENEKQRILKERLAQELHNKLMALYKMLPDSDSKLEQKLLTDFVDKKSFDGDSAGIKFKDIDGSTVDLSYKTGVVGDLKDKKNSKLDSLVKLEQYTYDNNYEEWVNNNKGDIISRIERPDPYFEKLIKSLKIKEPPPLNPVTRLKDLQPGDVILVGNNPLSFANAITGVDMAFSLTTNTNASHTILYLKEIAGQKVFLDNTPWEGEKIITETEFLTKYGYRPMEVSQLIAQPMSRNNGDNLYKAAFELVGENEQYIHDNPYSIFTGTKYGVQGDDMVCSEADRWVMVKAGFLFPKLGNDVKKQLGVDISPANYKEGYFYVTPLRISADKDY